MKVQATPEFATDFAATLDKYGQPPLRRQATTTLQINVGKRCNQACHHCHVEAGPKRTEVMPESVVNRCLALLETSPSIATLDLTGGAPELNPHFRRMVQVARARGLHVIDRCNLTILSEPGQENLADFLAAHQVEVTASLPCYSAKNVDKQRGRGVFDRSIEALQALNQLGYGQPGSNRILNLVYNPVGAHLPPDQARLEVEYKQALWDHFEIRFNQLFTITNMPIKRFADQLLRSGQHASYMSLLVQHFNPETVDALMCRRLVSVGWDGRLYDCDFNQMLNMPLGTNKRWNTVWDIDSFETLRGAEVAVGAHCFGCTAGAGSSCGGSLD